MSEATFLKVCENIWHITLQLRRALSSAFRYVLHGVSSGNWLSVYWHVFL